MDTLPVKHETESQQKKLGALCSRKYDVIVRERDGCIHAIIPELALIASGGDIETAHRRLDEKKKEFFGDMVASGAEDDIPLPRLQRAGDETIRQLRLFTIKAAIFCALLGFTFVLGAAVLSDKLANISVTGLAKRNVRAIAAEARMISSAPEKDRQRRLEHVREIATALKPYFGIFRDAWESSEPPKRSPRP